MEKTIVNLGEELFKIGQKKVQSYLECDLEHDFEFMRKYGLNTYCLLLRDCGTECDLLDHVIIENSAGNMRFNYYRSSAKEILKVVVTEWRGEEPYGYLQKWNIDNFYTWLEENQRMATTLNLELTLQDGTILPVTTPITETTYRDCIRHLNLSYEDIATVKYCSYQ